MKSKGVVAGLPSLPGLLVNVRYLAKWYSIPISSIIIILWPGQIKPKS